MSKYILFFDEISLKDVPQVGGKNASLGEMIRNLEKEGIRVPFGFATTADAYFYFLEKGKIKNRIKKILEKINYDNFEDLQKKTRKIREIILKTPLPQDLRKEILKAYEKLSSLYQKEAVDVAVRSSATAEDLPGFSFAGQQETYLNIKGKRALIEAVKKCFASLFTARATSYRQKGGFDHLKIALSCGIQKMVRSDLACAGVGFSIDTETGFPDVVLINGSWGLGEMVVQGKVIPDEFLVFKKTLNEYRPIIKKSLGEKKIKLIYTQKPVSGKSTTQVKTSLKERRSFVLSDDEVIELAKMILKIEEHYSKVYQKYTPMDVEWAKDGKDKKLYILQARPETVHQKKEKKYFEEYKLLKKGKVLLEGVSIGQKIGQGKVRLIKDLKDLGKFKKGEVLVTRMTNPDMEPVMKIAGGIITDEGGRTCFSGDTLILTNKGLLKIKDVVKKINKKETLFALSLNKKTLKLEWKRIKRGFKRYAPLIEIDVSQTGRMKGNTLKVTPDHKFLIIHKRKIISQEIKEILKNYGFVLTLEKIPSFKKASKESNQFAYVLGGLLTDGYIDPQGKEIQFIQKKDKNKIKFIKNMLSSFASSFNESFHVYPQKESFSEIRGKEIKGSSARFRCYKRKAILDFIKRKAFFEENILNIPLKNLLHFLGGVIDGDGTWQESASRINVFISKRKLLENVLLSLLRLGVSYQVTKNRNIWNIQIVDNIEKIFEFSSRLSGKDKRKRMGTHFLAAKAIAEDIVEKINYKGRVKRYVKENLLIDAEKLKKYAEKKLSDKKLLKEIQKIVSSPLKMVRVKFRKKLGVRAVYNIEVENNHNYVVFTKRYTPLLVENCHAAIISREHGIPCIVGTKKATQVLKEGQEVTLDCTQGEKGYVLEGILPFKKFLHEIEKIPQTKTKVCLNIGSPEIAFKSSFLPADGVGLAREEFIFASEIKVHPLALLHPEKVDKKTRKLIDKITAGFVSKKDYFVEKLAQGIGRIASAFFPKEVIVRFSDFKSNEYRELIGGKFFEPKEANPMIGFRGASRYFSEIFKEAFLLEISAIKKAKEDYGLKNISVMIPFCRTPEEGKEVKKIIQSAGLKDTKIYVMCEIPSNVVLADEFLKIFDGFSIGSNDLTQLTLGIDRDNPLLVGIGDERNPAVKKLISEAIKKCKEKRKYSGICGDAPSSFPEYCEFLVKEGIKAISVTPDAFFRAKLIVSQVEKKIKK